MATEDKYLSVGSVSNSVVFASTSYYTEIYNSGSVTAFINIGSAATINNFPVYEGETLKVYTDIPSVHAITSGASTTQLNIRGSN